MVYGFNVEAPAEVAAQARADSTPVRLMNVIYRLVDDVRQELNKLMPLKEVEEVIGQSVGAERQGQAGSETGGRDRLGQRLEGEADWVRDWREGQTHGSEAGGRGRLGQRLEGGADWVRGWRSFVSWHGVVWSRLRAIGKIGLVSSMTAGRTRSDYIVCNIFIRAARKTKCSLELSVLQAALQS